MSQPPNHSKRMNGLFVPRIPKYQYKSEGATPFIHSLRCLALSASLCRSDQLVGVLILARMWDLYDDIPAPGEESTSSSTSTANATAATASTAAATTNAASSTALQSKPAAAPKPAASTQTHAQTQARGILLNDYDVGVRAVGWGSTLAPVSMKLRGLGSAPAAIKVRPQAVGR